MRGECPAKCLLEEWMSPDQQKSKVNTQQKLGARTGPKVLQFLRLLSTRCLVLAGDACLSLSFSCLFFSCSSHRWWVIYVICGAVWVCAPNGYWYTQSRKRKVGVTDPAHTHAHSEAGRRETSKRGRVKKRQRTAVTKTSWEGEKIGDSMKHSKISIPPTSLLQKRPNKKK